MILKNATYIDYQTLAFKKTHILVEEGKNGTIHFLDKLPDNQKDTIDCEGKLVTKSFANGHHHIYSALARGMGAPKKNPENFYEILQYIWWTLDKSLDTEMIRASALVTAIAAAKAGCTFVIDHHASPLAVNGSLQTIADAFDEVGVSHLLCYEISDRDGDEIAQKGLQETENYLENNQALVGLHASFTVGCNTLKQAVDLANKYHTGIHIHVAEDHYDQSHSEKNYNRRVVERLHKTGVLQSSKTILGHCLHLTDVEKELIKNSPAFVVQNTESNLNNRVGFFNAKGLGDNIMMGTDGMHSDMLRSAKAAFFAGQAHDTIDFSEAYRRFRNVHNYLKINQFEGDSANNLVVLNYDSPTPVYTENFLGHFLFGWESRQVEHVISDGKLIVKNGEIQTVNETEILNFAQRQAKKLWKKMQGVKS